MRGFILVLMFTLTACSLPTLTSSDIEYDQYNCTDTELDESQSDRCNQIRYENYKAAQSQKEQLQ